MHLSVYSALPACFIVVSGTLFVHMCYQLSVSVLTHFSGHALGRGASVRRLGWLSSSYVIGVLAATTLLLMLCVYIVSTSSALGTSVSFETLTIVIIGIAQLVGMATILWYYRRGKGTQLWLPRNIATFLLERSRRTRRGFEAFLLGVGTVVGELPFVIAPLLLMSLVITTQPTISWLGWSIGYATLVSLPLLFVSAYIISGHSVVRVQQWRQDSKTFLQWTSGITLLLLTLYIAMLQLGVAS